jgi:DNA-binding MarR family transcriptional regulator
MSNQRIRVYVPLIRKFATRVVLFHSIIASKVGLNTTDLQALRLLREESMSASSLGALVGLAGPSMTALIDRLEKGGYVVRERGSQDRRRVTVHAIPEKLREVDTYYESQGTKMAKLLSTYSADEFRVITDFLEQSIQVLSNEVTRLQDKNG